MSKKRYNNVNKRITISIFADCLSSYYESQTLYLYYYLCGGQGKDGNPVQCGQVSAGCLVKSPYLNATPEEVKSCIQNDQLLLACGKKVPLLSNACVETSAGVRSKMPVVKSRVREKTVDVLRDTGCSGVVVKKDLVDEDQFTGDCNVMLITQRRRCL